LTGGGPGQKVEPMIAATNRAYYFGWYFYYAPTRAPEDVRT
jgi:hypothetical protein